MKPISNYIHEKLFIKSNTKTNKYYIKDYNDFCEYITKHYDNDKKYLDLSNISFNKAVLETTIQSRNFIPMREFIKENDVKKINVSNWEFDEYPNIIAGAFRFCTSLTEIIGLDTWDVSNTKQLDSIFEACASITDFSDIEYWDVSNCVSFTSMFDNCSRLKKLDFSHWTFPKSVNNIAEMFARCFHLEEIKGLGQLPVNDKVTTLNSVFSGCKRLKELDLTNWRPKLSRSNRTFFNCIELTTIGDISNWDFTNNLDTTDMFNGCVKLNLDMSMCKMNISVTKVRMFKDANKKIKKPNFKP